MVVRFNALSRAVESALQKEGIASRVLGGHKFFERAEVCLFVLLSGIPVECDIYHARQISQIKDLLAYLQIVDNPHFVPAFSRAINTPNRGIGDKVNPSP